MTSVPSDVYTTFLFDPSQEEPSRRIANAASVGFEGLKTTLRTIKETADVFPPLKSAVGGLLALIEMVEVCVVNDWLQSFAHLGAQKTVQNRDDFADLTRKLAAVVSIVSEHRHDSESSPFTRRLNGLLTSVFLKCPMHVLMAQY